MDDDYALTTSEVPVKGYAPPLRLPGRALSMEGLSSGFGTSTCTPRASRAAHEAPDCIGAQYEVGKAVRRKPTDQRAVGARIECGEILLKQRGNVGSVA